MSRLAAILLALLVLSNLAWLVLGGATRTRNEAPSAPTTDPTLVEENESLRKTVEELTRVVAAYEAAGDEKAAKPVKAPRPARTPSMSEKAWPIADGWAKEALQIKDAAKRQAAIDAIRAGMQSGDPLQQLAALMASTWTA